MYIPQSSDDDESKPAATQGGSRALAGKLGRTAAKVKVHRPSPILRKMRKETGLGRSILQRLAREHKGNPQLQLVNFFREFPIPALTGRSRKVSSKTENRYFDALKTVLRLLPALNMRIGNLTELSHKHARAVILALEKRGDSASQLATVNTALRRFGTWLGKPDLVPVLSEVVRDPARAVRRTTSIVPKSWEAKGVDPEEPFAAMEKECAITAMQLRLGFAFGLRVEEQLCLRPNESDLGETLLIMHGTKGGRVRKVKIEKEWERELLDRAKAMAHGLRDGILSVEMPGVKGKHMKLHKVKKRYYNLCQKIGLTRKGRFGTTPHGLRHSFACRRYERATGELAPVLGGAMPSPEVDLQARLAVSRELGHGRVSATAAYASTVYTMQREHKAANERLHLIEDLLGSDQQLLDVSRQAAVSTFCLVGPAAEGDKPALIVVFCEGVSPIPPHLMERILERTGQLLRAKCILASRDSPGMRDLATFEIVALGRQVRASAPNIETPNAKPDAGTGEVK